MATDRCSYAYIGFSKKHVRLPDRRVPVLHALGMLRFVPSKALVLVFAGVLLHPVSGQNPQGTSDSAQQTEIKSLLEKQLQDHHLAGIAAIVVRSNAIVGIATAGVKRQGRSAPLGSADMFHLGSNTKAITATMIARLVEAGKLSWTSTPLELFPELNATMHAAFRQITLEQLLSHHAGIPPYDRFKALPKLSGSAMEQRSRFAALALNQAPAITPGTKALYSNGGFVIAAAMAERSTGSSWEQLVASQVLKPLGMQAIFAFPLSADMSQPWGHTETKIGLEALDQLDEAAQVPLYLLPAGGMAMTLGDYGRFLQMNLKGLRGEDDNFLSAKTIQRLHFSSTQDEYALGWGVTQMDGVLSSTHAGSAGSFYAIVALQPSRNLGVAVVLNSAGERSSQAAAVSLKAFLTKYAASVPR